MDANPGGDRSPTGAAPRLDLVFYWVADLDRAVAFYRDLLGLPLMRRDGERWAEFDAGGRRFALHSAEDQPPSTSGATAVFSVGDLDLARVTLSAHGLSATSEGDVQGYARFATFLDPDGNTFQLIEYETRPG